MCNLKGPFKLCTCSGDNIDKSKPYWILRRRIVSEPDWTVIGSTPIKPIPWGIDIDFVRKQLNSGNVFDFDYKPRRNDELTFVFPKQGEYVLYYRGRWWTDTQDEVGCQVINSKKLHSGVIG